MDRDLPSDASGCRTSLGEHFSIVAGEAGLDLTLYQTSPPDDCWEGGGLVISISDSLVWVGRRSSASQCRSLCERAGSEPHKPSWVNLEPPSQCCSGDICTHHSAFRRVEISGIGISLCKFPSSVIYFWTLPFPPV